MGTRSDPNGKHDTQRKQAVRRSMDDHLKKSAALINVCLECNLAVEDLLRSAVATSANNSMPTASNSKPLADKTGARLATRPEWEHHVCILEYNGNNTDTVMIAARTRSFSALEVLYSENINETAKANTRLLICKATSHVAIPRLGTEIIIFAVHGHHETMKKPSSVGYKLVWDKVGWAIKKFLPHFFMGDFNMALLLVPSELHRRDLVCHVLAYYPWRFTGDSRCSYSQTLGLDSCGIFYLREDDVESRLLWPASHIQRLLSAGKSCGVVRSDYDVELHTYENPNRAPGKPWWNYQCSAKNYESANEKHLETMLQGFLDCRMPQEAWQHERADTKSKVTWTRFKQKPVPQDVLFVNGDFHCGAHMNLMVFTANAISRRSAEGQAKQKRVKSEKYWGKREAQAKPISRSPSRSRSQSRTRWRESDWKGDRQWSGHQWNDDPW